MVNEELDRIAVYVSNSRHGDFLKTFATCWQFADMENKAILRPAWMVLIKKYELDKEYKEAKA
jgi:hypothetical protein